MTEPLRVLRVFLASPGDLLDERQVAREVVDEINEVIRPLQLHVDLLGWEDTRPGAGRPQAIINRDVDACDLFVGLMWRHWGTPTGTHTSGFEEEFERAQRRRADQGAPDIWLSFKAVGPEHLRDPGPQLLRVLDFRQQQIERREVLFKEFGTSEEWRSLFRKWLLSLVLELSRTETTSTGVISSVPATAPMTTTEQPLGSSGPIERSSQLRDLSEFICSLDPGMISVVWPDQDNNKAIAHLQVTASAAMATVYHDVRLGIHEANLVYASREHVELTAFERFHIIRSVIADTAHRIPGWYWFIPTDIASAMFLFVADRDETVATMALSLLRRAQMAPTSEYAQRVLSQQLKSASAGIRDAAAEYFAAMSDTSFIKTVPIPSANATYVEEHLAVRLRRGDETALDELDGRPSLSDRLQSAVRSFVTTANANNLVRACTSRHELMRIAACDALIRAGLMTDSLAFALARDNSVRVRSLAFGALIAAGAEIDLEALRAAIADLPLEERRERLVAYYRRLPLPSLLERLGYIETDGREIYEAAGLEYPRQSLSRVRSDLETEMSQFHSDWLTRLRDTHTPDAAQEIEDAWNAHPEVLTFIKNQYIAAALRILAARGAKSDIAHARKYINSDEYDIVAAAVAIVARFGVAADAVVLVDVAQRSYGGTVDTAAAAATKLSKHVQRVLLPLLKSGKPPLIRAALRSIQTYSKDRATRLLRDLLLSDVPVTRILATACLVQLGRERAEAVFGEYLEGYRYYDVVTWFDRLLYAPEPLQDVFRAEIDAIR